jgi:hypothetical protein
MTRRRAAWSAVGLVAVLLTACGTGSGSGSGSGSGTGTGTGTGTPAGSTAPPSSPSRPLTAAALAAGAGHACIAGPGAPAVDWSHLANPVLSYPRAGVKDQALIWAGGTWHLLFSYVTDDPSGPGGVHWDIATATSPDLLHWSAASAWPDQAGTLGVASPDIVRDPAGRFVVTYQSDPGGTTPAGVQARLFYRTSPNLVTWSPPHPLAPSLAPSPHDRMIDGAFVFTGHQLLLGFKYSSPRQPDVFELARSTSGLPQGPWQPVGRPDIDVVGGTIENYEFVMVAGRWRLVATSDNLDQPWMFTLAGNPDTTTGWLRWTDGHELDLPAQSFNSGPGISSIGFEHANSAFLCDAGSLPGHFVYLLYAGSEELSRFGGWGQARIGIARSTDLVHWQVPPG